jgi:hypothetical protein
VIKENYYPPESLKPHKKFTFFRDKQKTDNKTYQPPEKIKINGFEFQNFKNLQGLKILKNIWNGLFKKSINRSYYCDWRWYYALLKNSLINETEFICIFKDTVPIAIFPIQTKWEKHKGITYKVLGFPRHSHTHLADIVLDANFVDGAIFIALLSYLKSTPGFLWQVVEFKNFVERSAIKYLLKETIYPTQVIGENAYFNCNTDKDLPSKVSKKFVKNINRLQKKAENNYSDIMFEKVNTIEALPQAFEHFLNVESSGWKGKQGTGTAISLYQDLIGFYQDLMKLFACNDGIQINLLKFNNVIAAAQFCIRSETTLYIPIPLQDAGVNF